VIIMFVFAAGTRDQQLGHGGIVDAAAGYLLGYHERKRETAFQKNLAGRRSHRHCRCANLWAVVPAFLPSLTTSQKPNLRKFCYGQN
jgi:hypothetical protein